MAVSGSSEAFCRISLHCALTDGTRGAAGLGTAALSARAGAGDSRRGRAGRGDAVAALEAASPSIVARSTGTAVAGPGAASGG